MAEITTLFWDIGGVVLTNGWDRHARRNCIGSFGLQFTSADQLRRQLHDVGILAY